MNTLEKLAAHLDTPTNCVHAYTYKVIAAPLVCADGYSMSVQASEFHYCLPRDNLGPYTHVEVWMCGDVPEWEEYGDADDDGARYPYARVPVELVAQVIDQHGGFKYDEDGCACSSCDNPPYCERRYAVNICSDFTPRADD